MSQLALMVPEGQGGFSLYTIPARTIADTPGFGFQQLDRVIELGGQQLLDQTVANLLQVPVQYHIQLTYPTLEIATEQAGSINFRTDRPLAMNVAGETMNLASGDNSHRRPAGYCLLKASSADGQAGPKIQTLFTRACAVPCRLNRSPNALRWPVCWPSGWRPIWTRKLSWTCLSPSQPGPLFRRLAASRKNCRRWSRLVPGTAV